MTREQVAVMVSRAVVKLGLAKNLTSEQAYTTLSAFGDSAKVSAWAQSGLALAVNKGIVTGQGGKLLPPQARATRAEAASVTGALTRWLAVHRRGPPGKVSARPRRKDYLWLAFPQLVTPTTKRQVRGEEFRT